MEVLRLSLRRYRFFPEFGARLPINSSAGCGTRRPSGGPGRMSFRCAPRVPDRSGLGAAGPAVVRRLRYLRRAIICFHVPNSRIRSFHIRQPWLAVSYCVPTMKSFSSSDFMRRNRKLENRYIKYMIGLRCIVRFRHVFLQGMPERSDRSRRDSDGFSQPGQSNEPRGGTRSGSLAFCPAARSVPGRGNRRRAFRSGVALRWTNDENVIPLPP